MSVKKLMLMADYAVNALIALGCLVFVAIYPVIFAITVFEANAYQITQVYAYGYMWDTIRVMIIISILSLTMLRVALLCANRLDEIANALKGVE